MVVALLRASVLRAAPAGARALAPQLAPAAARFARLAPRASAASAAAPAAGLKLATAGTPETLEYRIWQQGAGGATVSAWHDIPLYAGSPGLLNFVCEIPAETSAKMELSTKEAGNPIKQDVKKGAVRFYPYNINWNYGMLPQTWEDPAHKNAECFGAGGDNDPVDVVEIGSQRCEMGGVYAVKPLGVYAMVDDGEVDWKVVCIRADDPKAGAVHDVEDVEREFPGELERVLHWFRDYKKPDGKPENKFGYDSRCLDRGFALSVVEETHGFYNALRSGRRENTEGMALY